MDKRLLGSAALALVLLTAFFMTQQAENTDFCEKFLSLEIARYYNISTCYGSRLPPDVERIMGLVINDSSLYAILKDYPNETIAELYKQIISVNVSLNRSVFWFYLKDAQCCKLYEKWGNGTIFSNCSIRDIEIVSQNVTDMCSGK